MCLCQVLKEYNRRLILICILCFLEMNEVELCCLAHLDIGKICLLGLGFVQSAGLQEVQK